MNKTTQQTDQAREKGGQDGASGFRMKFMQFVRDFYANKEVNYAQAKLISELQGEIEGLKEWARIREEKVSELDGGLIKIAKLIGADTYQFGGWQRIWQKIAFEKCGLDMETATVDDLKVAMILRGMEE